MENYEPSKILNKNFEDKMWLFSSILQNFMLFFSFYINMA
jgi:hypothetical protein